YGADPDSVDVVAPGVDLTTFAPGPVDRAALGLPDNALVLLFVGRIQPLKAPDVLLRAAARIVETDPELARRLHVVVMGAASGTDPAWLPGLAATLGVRGRCAPPVGRPELAASYRAAALTVVPSYNASFGLVALESQAWGPPVVAAAVGGLPTAVADGRSGVLVEGHDPGDWATVLAGLLRAPRRLAQLAFCARQP